jgi:concentrative nucleoside transporter, CNT family
MILHTIAGFMGLIVLAWAMSEDRRGIPWRTVAAGVALQWVIGALLLKLPVFKDLFLLLNNLLLALEKATQAGTAFVFGYLGGGEAPFIEKTAGLSFVLAFRALPLVLVVSALSALLFYWRILPLLVRTLQPADPDLCLVRIC